MGYSMLAGCARISIILKIWARDYVGGGPTNCDSLSILYSSFLIQKNIYIFFLNLLALDEEYIAIAYQILSAIIFITLFSLFGPLAE